MKDKTFGGWHPCKLSYGRRLNQCKRNGENDMIRERWRLIPIGYILFIKGTHNGTPLVLEKLKLHGLKRWAKDSVMYICVKSMQERHIDIQCDETKTGVGRAKYSKNKWSVLAKKFALVCVRFECSAGWRLQAQTFAVTMVRIS